MESYVQPEKNTFRTSIISDERLLQLKLQKGSIVTALLPSTELADFREMWDTGRTDRKDFVLAIENNAAKAEVIDATLKHYDVKHKVVCSDLHRIDLAQELEGRQLDWAYLDTCTTLHRAMSRWLASIDCQEVFAANAIMYFAFVEYRQAGYKFYRRLFNSLEPHLIPVNPRTVWGNPNMDKQDLQHTVMYSALYNLFGNVASSYIYKNLAARKAMHVFEFNMSSLYANREELNMNSLGDLNPKGDERAWSLDSVGTAEASNDSIIKACKALSARRTNERVDRAVGVFEAKRRGAQIQM